jgi:hypothetical protein
MNADEVRRMARLIIGSDHPRGHELRSWLEQGEMSESQAVRVGRRTRPPCFTSDEQWIAWCIHEAGRPIFNGSGYCHDCTARHKNAMQVNGLCEHPLTIFKRASQSSAIVGVRPYQTRVLHRTKRRREKRAKG